MTYAIQAESALSRPSTMVNIAEWSGDALAAVFEILKLCLKGMDVYDPPLQGLAWLKNKSESVLEIVLKMFRPNIIDSHFFNNL